MRWHRPGRSHTAFQKKFSGISSRRRDMKHSPAALSGHTNGVRADCSGGQNVERYDKPAIGTRSGLKYFRTSPLIDRCSSWRTDILLGRRTVCLVSGDAPRAPRQRSQRDRTTWKRMEKLVERCGPSPGHLTHGPLNASASNTQGGSRMREFRTYGSVRGALSNERPYRDRLCKRNP
jgi:hypothetical protein